MIRVDPDLHRQSTDDEAVEDDPGRERFARPPPEGMPADRLVRICQAGGVARQQRACAIGVTGVKLAAGAPQCGMSESRPVPVVGRLVVFPVDLRILACCGR